MSERKIFVGRKAELEQFKKVLEDPKGQAVLVVGNRGMGKTWLVNKMAALAENHPDLKCGCVRYEVTPTDSVDSTMALMMDNAFEAAQVKEGSFVGTKRGLEQWRSLLNVVNIGDLAMSLRHDPAKNTREQFLERLQLVSERMPENGRAIFIIDPEKYMQDKSDYAWGLVISKLPSKVKFLFPQRQKGVLIRGEGLEGCNNVVRIPEGELRRFDEKTTDELVEITMSEKVGVVDAVKVRIRKSDRKPYTIGGAANLMAHTTIQMEYLAKYLTQEEVVGAQWRGICSNGEEAKRLFEAYAILEVGVPDEVAEAVSKLDADTLQNLWADNYLSGLLREEGYGKRIYHAILADYILEQISEAEAKQYHSRVVDVYRKKLADAKKQQIKPDALAAKRLAEHVLIFEGKKAFVEAFINESGKALQDLGFLDAFISLSEKAITYTAKGSKWEAILFCNLGLIYQKRANLDKAEQMFRKSLMIEKKLGRLKGMASDYGNLGGIYLRKDDLDRAEQMLKKSLEINEKLGQLENMAMDYGNLGAVYQTRADWDKAEEMHRQSLMIAQQLGLKHIVANDYGNLGLIHKRRGDLEKAEDMFRKSLEISDAGGMTELTANQYVNSGSIYKQRGDAEKTKEYLEKALELYKKIGILHMVEKVQRWMDELDSK